MRAVQGQNLGFDVTGFKNIGLPYASSMQI